MREMAGAVPEVSRDSETAGKQFYCRKEKSLGVLCSNFLKLYNRDGVDLIGLDDAAIKLGVERRRIYDVVNILESVGVRFLDGFPLDLLVMDLPLCLFFFFMCPF
uniref:E2F/DP family winged-helix DNA-binding domain-containing protein n=1 Tax=Rhizophora mucronata TaxID=61149 RepID=A0A2P2K4R8_RHIMU